MTVHRTNDRPSATQAYQCLLSHFLASFGAQEKNWLHINAVITWQLSKQGIRWPVSPDRIVGSGVDPSRLNIFLKLSADKLLVFKWSQAQVCFLKIYMKYVVFMSLWPSTIKILISNLPRTRKFSQLFKNTGGEDLFLPWSRVVHAPRPIFML